MTYKTALDFLHTGKRHAKNPSLERMRCLMKKLGNPEKRLRFIHVAGTNGKGSTSTMMAKILECSGYKTGLFVSPYVSNFRERISIDGKMIGILELIDCVRAVRIAANNVRIDIENARNLPAGESPAGGSNIPEELLLPDAETDFLEFELVTAVGLYYFAKSDCQIVVLECGIGGKYDSTNIIPPPTAEILTQIDLDHTELLGDTPEKIAEEKCGIIKKDTGVVISYPQSNPEVYEVIKNRCEEFGVRLVTVDSEKTELILSTAGILKFNYIPADGEKQLYSCRLSALYQMKNACTTIEAVEALRKIFGYRITNDHIKQGLERAFIPARFELFSIAPAIIIDGAHNPSGVKAFLESCDAVFGNSGSPIYMIIGMLSDKSLHDSLAIAAQYTKGGTLGRLNVKSIVCLEVQNPRTSAPEELTAAAQSAFSGITDNIYWSRDKITTASELVTTCTKTGGTILCFGSLYLAGEMRDIFEKLLTEG
jgi:dihydrofolate synthase/folylpolyglutamate synthase